MKLTLCFVNASKLVEWGCDSIRIFVIEREGLNGSFWFSLFGKVQKY